MADIILASQSPRRKEILQQVGIEFECFPSDREEICSTNVPCDMVVELALLKAMDVAEKIALALECGQRTNGRERIEKLKLENSQVAKTIYSIYQQVLS